MKILVLVKASLSAYNPYVQTLMQEISRLFPDVEWSVGIENFWTDKCFEYDIIHIHWPDVFIWYPCGFYNVGEIIGRLQLLKDNGVKIISTCHNLVPHYKDKGTLNYKLYDVVYGKSDAIIHLGKYSLDLFYNKYIHAMHYLMAHHVYDTIYTSRPTYVESIKALHLSFDKQYILCFGAFRNDEERRLVIYLAEKFKKKNICFLAPSFLAIPKRRNFLYLVKPALRHLYYKMRYSNIIFEKGWVSDAKLMYYYGASSISLIHRLHILNSGNLPLGFLMKQVVVGPNRGNVGYILKTTGNPVFEPTNNDSLLEAICKAQILVRGVKGEENFKYAMENWNTARISEELYHIYKTEINR